MFLLWELKIQNKNLLFQLSWKKIKSLQYLKFNWITWLSQIKYNLIFYKYNLFYRSHDYMLIYSVFDRSNDLMCIIIFFFWQITRINVNYYNIFWQITRIDVHSHNIVWQITRINVHSHNIVWQITRIDVHSIISFDR